MRAIPELQVALQRSAFQCTAINFHILSTHWLLQCCTRWYPPRIARPVPEHVPHGRRVRPRDVPQRAAPGLPAVRGAQQERRDEGHARDVRAARSVRLPSACFFSRRVDDGLARADAEECWSQLTNALKEVPGLPGPSSAASERFVEQYMTGVVRRE